LQVEPIVLMKIFFLLSKGNRKEEKRKRRSETETGRGKG